MFDNDLPYSLPGTRMSSGDYNKVVRVVDKLQRKLFGFGLAQQTNGSGDMIQVVSADSLVVQITDTSAGNGSYGWQEQVGVASGQWTTQGNPRTGTVSPVSDPAWEVNRSTSVPQNAYVWLEREPATNEWRFVYGAGGSGLLSGVNQTLLAAGTLSNPTVGTMNLLVQRTRAGAGATATGATIIIRNRYGQSIPAGALVYCDIEYGFNFVVSSDCAKTPT